MYYDYVYPGNQTNISNEIFTFSLSSANDKLSVDLPTGSGIILDMNTSQIKDDYDIHFKGISFWYHNYTLDKMFYKAYVKIYRVLPDTANIELTRTIENADLLIGEETEIDVTLKNTGDEKATNIIYSDPFPQEFEITEVSGALIEYSGSKSTIKWTGSLYQDNEKKISYKIKALNKAVFESNASLSYNNGTGIKKIYSETETITVPDYQLNVSIDLDKEEIVIGDEINIDINLTNVNSEFDIKGIFSITIPKGLNVKSYKNIGRNDRIYSWQNTLEPGDSKIFNMTLEGVIKRNYILEPEIIFKINSVEKKIEKQLNINVYDELPAEPVVIEEVIIPEEIEVEVEEEVEEEVVEEVTETEEELAPVEKEVVIEEEIVKKDTNPYMTLVIIFFIVFFIVAVIYVKRQSKKF